MATESDAQRAPSLPPAPGPKGAALPSFGVPKTLPPAITCLSQAVESVGAACEAIVSEIHGAAATATAEPSETRAVPFLYDAGELAGKCPVALTYAVKRLIKGLAATALHTRANHGAALLALLIEFKDALPSAVVLKWIDFSLSKSAVAGEGFKMTPTQETAVMTGRILGYDALVRAGSAAGIGCEVARRLLAIWNEHALLSFMAQNTLAALLGACVPAERKNVLAVIGAFLAKQSTPSAKLAALVLLLRYQHDMPPVAGLAQELCGDLFLPANTMALLALLDHSYLDAPPNVALLSALLAALKKTQRLRELRSTWEEVVALLSRRVTVGGPLLLHLSRELLADESSVQIARSILSQAFVESQLGQDPSLAVHSLSSTIAAHPALTAHVATRLLAAECNISVVVRVLEAVPGCSIKDTLVAIPKDGNPPLEEKFQLRFADLHLALLRPGTAFLSSPDAPQTLLASLITYSQSQQPPSPGLASRIQGILARLLAGGGEDGKREGCRDRWVRFCLAEIEAGLASSPGKGAQLLEEMGEPVRDAWEVAGELIPRLERLLAKTAPGTSKVHLEALLSLALAGKLFLILDPLASASIFEDLRACYKAVVRGGVAEHKHEHEQGSSEPTPIDVIVEILLQWLSRSSAALRSIADQIFESLVPSLTPNTLQVIFQVLTTAPGNENELMDNDLVEESDSDSDSDLEEEPETEGGEAGEENDNSNQGESESESESESEDENPLNKRIKISLSQIQRSASSSRGVESSEGEEESDIKLEDADADDLDQLDAHLSAIMSSRKRAHGTHTTARRELVHFKQRVCDWLQLIVRGLPAEQSFMTRVVMIPMFAQVFEMHTERKGRKADGKLAIDRELVEKVEGLFSSFYIRPEKAPLSLATKDTAECVEMSKSILERVGETLRTGNAAGLLRASTAFCFLLQVLPEDAELSTLVDALRPVWIEFLKDGNKRHSIAFLKFFEQLRTRSPPSILALLADTETLLLLTDARAFTREKIYRFCEPILKSPAAGSQTPSSLSKYAAFFKAMSAFYLTGADSAEGYLRKLNPAQLRDELAFLNKLVCRSRAYLGEECSSVWAPALAALLAHAETLRSSLQGSQVESIRGRIKSIVGETQVKTK